MLNIERILFPIDFSERCCNAAPFVEAMARQYKAKVTLLSVADAVYYAPLAEPGGPIVVNTELVRDDLKSRLDSALRNEFIGLEVERVAEVGDPAQAIADYAETHRADLIMMPTHGYGRFRQFLLGSVAAKVLHDAQCPVWTAAHTSDPLYRNLLPYRSILCAVDGLPDSPDLVKWAGEFANDAGANLRLAYVLQGMKDFPSPQYREELRLEAEEKLDQFQEGLGFHVPASILFGPVAESIREEALRRAADLVIIGRGVIHEKLGRLRTHAYGIIHRAPCPVLSV